MKDNDSRSRVRSTTGAVSILVLFGLLVAVFVGLLMVTDTAVADLKATKVVYAWDYVAEKYQNSNVIIAANDYWLPFVHNLDFDTDPWIGAAGEEACPSNPGATTQWAGKMYYGLGYTDTNGGFGFRETQNWGLMSCDLNGDGNYLNNADLATYVESLDGPPPYTLSTLVPAGQLATPFVACAPGNPYCNLLTQDQVVACSQNTCSYEIVTTFIINLDTDCDGTPDLLPLSADPFDICFYAEARTPYALDPGYIAWGGNLQARISTVGGDKTVNFRLQPTAIDLASFGAARQGKGILVTWETANELDNLGFNLYRSASRYGNRAKVNGRLIASVAPGSATGASYSFLDEFAAPGRSYYYWLEALDLSGNSSEHVSALVKGLPGRRRPMPSP